MPPTNLIYTSYKKAALDGSIQILTDTIKAVLIDTALYTVNANHDFYNDIPGGAVYGTPQALGGRSTSISGTFAQFTANPTAWTGLAPSTATIGAVILFKDTGTPATSPLIFYGGDMIGLPLIAGLTEFTIVWQPNALLVL